MLPNYSDIQMYNYVNANYLTPSYRRKNKWRVAGDRMKRVTSCDENCMIKLRTFADETSIHGILNIVRNDRPPCIRVMWALAFTACFWGCFYLLGTSVVRYFKYEVITTESINTEKEIEFPSITFCNENLGRRSLLGGSSYFLKSLTTYILSYPDQYEDRLASVRENCKSDGETNLSIMLDKLNYKSWSYFGYTTMMHTMAPDSYYSIATCWWKDVEQEECNRLFLNHLTDYGWCFTFNPHPELLRRYSLGFNQNSLAYGLSKDYKMLKINNAGQHNGFRVLLNVHIDDYCVSRHDSVGFKISIHDPMTQPLFFLDRSIGVPPGFETIIGIKLRKSEKKTEHLTYCTKHQTLFLYPNVTVYFKESCYMQCFTEFVYEHCQCVPPYGPPGNSLTLAEWLNVSYVHTCWDSTMLCMKKYERQFLDVGIEDRCNWCLNPCSQLSYDLQLSQLYFPVKNYQDIVSNFSGNLQEFRQNYALVDFYVESMSVVVVTEIHAFTIDQLVADIGGQIGFLLGMSLLSVLEIVQLLLPHRNHPKSSLRRIKNNGNSLERREKY